MATVGAFPDPMATILPMVRGSMLPSQTHGSLGVFRLPTDALFNADLTLENIVVGSRYRVTRRSDGSELVPPTVAASTTEVITGIPVYSNPMLVDITVRNASGSPKYKVFDTAAQMTRADNSAYILQIED